MFSSISNSYSFFFFFNYSFIKMIDSLIINITPCPLFEETMTVYDDDDDDLCWVLSRPYLVWCTGIWAPWL